MLSSRRSSLPWLPSESSNRWTPFICRKYGFHLCRPASFFRRFSLARRFWNHTCQQTRLPTFWNTCHIFIICQKWQSLNEHFVPRWTASVGCWYVADSNPDDWGDCVASVYEKSLYLVFFSRHVMPYSINPQSQWLSHELDQCYSVCSLWPKNCFGAAWFHYLRTTVFVKGQQEQHNSTEIRKWERVVGVGVGEEWMILAVWEILHIMAEWVA